jgi:hypothetical protein
MTQSLSFNYVILTIKFSFETRFQNWHYLEPSCLVDTTFVEMNTPILNPWEYYSSNKNAYGLVYQVCASLGKPFRILSFDGPFKGSAADVSILRSTLIPKLRKGEKIMCDKGYRYEEKCWCPPTGKMATLSKEDKIRRREVTKIRQLNERVINRIWKWGLFQRKWTKTIKLHKLCAHTAARLTQLELYAHRLT